MRFTVRASQNDRNESHTFNRDVHVRFKCINVEEMKRSSKTRILMRHNFENNNVYLKHSYLKYERIVTINIDNFELINS